MLRRTPNRSLALATSLILILLTLAVAWAAQPLSALAGKWAYASESEFWIVEETLYLLDDGRYFSLYTTRVPGLEPDVGLEEGRYEIAGGTLTFRPWCAAEKSFPFQLRGDTLVIDGQDDLGNVASFTYTAEPGSRDAVIAEVQALDADRAAEWRPYLARTPLGPARPGSVAEPGLPVDPNPGHVFADAAVFVEGELYTFLSEWTYVFDVYGQLQSVSPVDLAFDHAKLANLDHTRGSYRDNAQWYLLPNGRFFSRTELYGLAVSTDPLTPQTTAFWGRYRVDGDTLTVETDAGEVVRYALLDGRRVMGQAGEGVCYSEVEWATERLDQQADELDGN